MTIEVDGAVFRRAGRAGQPPTGWRPAMPLGFGQYPWNDPPSRPVAWGGNAYHREGTSHVLLTYLLVRELTAATAAAFLVERGATGEISWTADETVVRIRVNGTLAAFADADGVWWRPGLTYPVDASIELVVRGDVSYLVTDLGDPLLTPAGDRLYVENN